MREALAGAEWLRVLFRDLRGLPFTETAEHVWLLSYPLFHEGADKFGTRQIDVVNRSHPILLEREHAVQADEASPADGHSERGRPVD